MSKGDMAAEWLKPYLSSGPKEFDIIEHDAKGNCISPYALGEAKKKLGVVSEKRGIGSFDVWFWMLPEHQEAWLAANRMPSGKPH